MKKVAGLARVIAIFLAIIAGFVAIPNLDVTLALVVLGLIAGLGYCEDTATRLILTVLVLPAVGAAVGAIPAVGAQLSAIAGGLAVATASAVATVLVVRLYNLVVGDLKGLAAKE